MEVNMKKYFMMLMIMLLFLLVSCNNDTHPKLTVHFYNSEDASLIYVVTSDDAEYQMKKSNKDLWYEFTFSVLSLDNPDFSIHFKYDDESTNTFYILDSENVYFT